MELTGKLSGFAQDFVTMPCLFNNIDVPVMKNIDGHSKVNRWHRCNPFATAQLTWDIGTQ